MEKNYTLLSACIAFFGLREGQTNIEFAKGEYKALTDKDKDEIKTGLIANGYNIINPLVEKAA